MDTGIASHLDLNIAGGHSVISNDYNDNNGHGTAVAGVISALINDEGIIGTAPEIDLYAVKIMESSSGDLSDAIAGLEWAINNSMDIVSMSFGFNSYSQIFKEVLEEAYNNGILLVAAAGNNGKDDILYPAKYNKVIAVGAVNKNNNRASFSSYGFDMELVAPGVDINSTSLNNKYTTSSGSSMSTPHVTGVVALIKAFNNSLTNVQIRNKLRNDALDLGNSGWDMLYGFGLVQANLDLFNFTEHNYDYFYRVFNISNYNTPQQENIFWLEAQGHVDDVSFLPGMYLINITKFEVNRNYIYNVSENGSKFVLALSIDHFDNFTQEGTNNDKIVWKDGNISTRQLGSNPSLVEGICYEQGSFSIDYDWCFFDSTAHKNECDDNPVNDIDCGGHTTCKLSTYQQAFGSGWHTYIDTSTAHSDFIQSKYWINCDPADSEGPSNSPFTYYVVDMKRARCLNSSDYVIEGRYATNSWVQIGSQQNCGSEVCTLAVNSTNPNTILNPCLPQNLCTGTVQVIAEDNLGNPINATNVYSSGEFDGNTNEFGFFNREITGHTCGQSIPFNVSCSDNVTVCDQQSTSLETLNDYKSLVFDCSICSGAVDMETSIDNIEANVSTGKVRVTINLIKIPTTSNINVTFKVQGKDGLIAREIHDAFSVSDTSQKTATVTKSITLSDGDFLHVYIDPNGQVTETDEKNNYARVPLFKKEITAFIDVNTSYPLVDDKIKEFISQYVKTTNDPDSAQVSIYVGKKSPQFNSRIGFTSLPQFMKNPYYYLNTVYYNNKVVSNKPYIGIVGGYKDTLDGKNYIVAFGNDIDGDIAAVKKLISARSLFLNKDNLAEERTKVIDELDRTGIAVADLLREEGNFVFYTQRNGAGFANVVDRILNNNNFEIAINTVKTTNDNTTLRMKNVNSDFSQNFADAIVGNSKPVVLARGLWSNLLTWQDFGEELAFDEENARDTWLIEITGGPEQDEKANAPNYEYEDLVDYYWPALITGVQNYSGRKQLDYVGFSNGCRVGLDSLKNWSSGKSNAGYVFDSQTGNYISSDLSSNAVDNFIGVGCPGAFEGESLFADCMLNYGEDAIGFFEDVGINHPTQEQLAERLQEEAGILNPSCYILASTLDSQGRISLNLSRYYLDLIQSNQDQQPGAGLSLNRFSILYGTNGFGTNNDNDYIVTEEDELDIFNNVNSNGGRAISYHLRHNQLPNNEDVKNDISQELN